MVTEYRISRNTASISTKNTSVSRPEGNNIHHGREPRGAVGIRIVIIRLRT